jgi:hypothetical protein
MPRDLKDLRKEIRDLPKERSVTVVYKVDTLKQVMGLLDKQLKLLK